MPDREHSCNRSISKSSTGSVRVALSPRHMQKLPQISVTNNQTGTIVNGTHQALKDDRSRSGQYQQVLCLRPSLAFLFWRKTKNVFAILGNGVSTTSQLLEPSKSSYLLKLVSNPISVGIVPESPSIPRKSIVITLPLSSQDTLSHVHSQPSLR